MPGRNKRSKSGKAKNREARSKNIPHGTESNTSVVLASNDLPQSNVKIGAEEHHVISSFNDEDGVVALTGILTDAAETALSTTSSGQPEQKVANHSIPSIRKCLDKDDANRVSPLSCSFHDDGLGKLDASETAVDRPIDGEQNTQSNLPIQSTRLKYPGLEYLSTLASEPALCIDLLVDHGEPVSDPDSTATIANEEALAEVASAEPTSLLGETGPTTCSKNSPLSREPTGDGRCTRQIEQPSSVTASADSTTSGYFPLAALAPVLATAPVSATSPGAEVDSASMTVTDLALDRGASCVDRLLVGGGKTAENVTEEDAEWGKSTSGPDAVGGDNAADNACRGAGSVVDAKKLTDIAVGLRDRNDVPLVTSRSEGTLFADAATAQIIKRETVSLSALRENNETEKGGTMKEREREREVNACREEVDEARIPVLVVREQTQQTRSGDDESKVLDTAGNVYDGALDAGAESLESFNDTAGSDARIHRQSAAGPGSEKFVDNAACSFRGSAESALGGNDAQIFPGSLSALACLRLFCELGVVLCWCFAQMWLAGFSLCLASFLFSASAVGSALLLLLRNLHFELHLSSTVSSFSSLSPFFPLSLALRTLFPQECAPVAAAHPAPQLAAAVRVALDQQNPGAAAEYPCQHQSPAVRAPPAASASPARLPPADVTPPRSPSRILSAGNITYSTTTERTEAALEQPAAQSSEQAAFERLGVVDRRGRWSSIVARQLSPPIIHAVRLVRNPFMRSRLVTALFLHAPRSSHSTPTAAAVPVSPPVTVEDVCEALLRRLSAFFCCLCIAVGDCVSVCAAMALQAASWCAWLAVSLLLYILQRSVLASVRTVLFCARLWLSVMLGVCYYVPMSILEWGVGAGRELADHLTRAPELGVYL